MSKLQEVGNAKMTNFRWTVVAMLFFATTINYLDRQVLSLTWDEFIKPEFHWNESHYGTITSFFSIFYAISMLFASNFLRNRAWLHQFDPLDVHIGKVALLVGEQDGPVEHVNQKTRDPDKSPVVFLRSRYQSGERNSAEFFPHIPRPGIAPSTKPPIGAWLRNFGG